MTVLVCQSYTVFQSEIPFTALQELLTLMISRRCIITALGLLE